MTRMLLPHSGEVHIWHLDLDRPFENGVDRLSLLSSEERHRLDRMLIKKEQRSFLRCRSTLRVLLGRYLSRDPAQIEISYGVNGKPKVSGMCFNLSHSFDSCVYAFTLSSEVGVDVEHVRTLPDQDELAARYFSPGEVAEFACLSPGQRKRAFFACWTRKEAYVKACGSGLQRDFTTFQVSFTAAQEPRLVHIDGNEKAAADWQIHTFEPKLEYVAAVAYHGCRKQILCYDID